MDRSLRLVYVTTARLPTERAHGVQISRMCEAFANQGVEVVLLHPRRKQTAAGVRPTSLFDYYGIAPVFAVRALPNWDLVRWDRWIPGELFVRIYFAYSLLWSLYAAAVASRMGADLYFTREAEVAYWLLRFGLPTVFEPHAIPKRAQRRLIELSCRRPALRLMVTLTSFAKSHFCELGVPPEKVIVQLNGVELDPFDRLPSREECRRQLGLPVSEPIVGYVGRFETMGMEKGVLNLVRSIAAVPQRPLLICVGGPMGPTRSYQREARRLGIPEDRVRFLDRVPHVDVPRWIRACDVVTIPWSWTEFSAYVTSPLKLFEYMAGGAAIVASDLPSLREVVRDGVHARFVKPGDASALSLAIADLLGDSDYAALLAAQARKEVARYTWTARAKKILSSVFPEADDASNAMERRA